MAVNILCSHVENQLLSHQLRTSAIELYVPYQSDSPWSLSFPQRTIEAHLEAMTLVPTLSHKGHILAKFQHPGRQPSDAHSSLWFAVNQFAPLCFPWTQFAENELTSFCFPWTGVSGSLGRGGQLSLWDSTAAASILALVSLLINCVQLGMFQRLSELEETLEIN